MKTVFGCNHISHHVFKKRLLPPQVHLMGWWYFFGSHTQNHCAPFHDAYGRWWPSWPFGNGVRPGAPASCLQDEPQMYTAGEILCPQSSVKWEQPSDNVQMLSVFLQVLQGFISEGC